MRIIIIGNSATAVGAVESLRQHDQTVEVLVISGEPHLIYSRPLLSHYLAGEIDRARLAYRPADFYSRHNVQPLLNDPVVAIDVEAHTVCTASGHEHAYDRLLICTGGTPIVPPIPRAAEMRGVFAFTTLDDVSGIIRYLAEHPVRHAVVVGGGMIGIKAVDALHRRGVSLTLVELAPRILSAALDETGSRLLTGLLHDAGIEVCAENTVTDLSSQNGRLTGVTLRDGREIAAQLLVFGIGVRPNASLAQQAGIAVNRGIVVDEHMRTSAPDVYAAGDVAEAYDLVVDMNRIVAIWPNAYRQGGIAGAHMVGAPRVDAGGVAMNTVEVCGVPAMSIGSGNVEGPEYELLTDLDAHHHRYKRLVIRDDRLVGAILVGQVSRAGIYTGLIRNRLNVSACRRSLMSEQFGLLSLPANYRKHIVTGAGIEV